MIDIAKLRDDGFYWIAIFGEATIAEWCGLSNRWVAIRYFGDFRDDEVSVLSGRIEEPNAVREGCNQQPS